MYFDIIIKLIELLNLEFIYSIQEFLIKILEYNDIYGNSDPDYYKFQCSFIFYSIVWMPFFLDLSILPLNFEIFVQEFVYKFLVHTINNGIYNNYIDATIN